MDQSYVIILIENLGLINSANESNIFYFPCFFVILFSAFNHSSGMMVLLQFLFNQKNTTKLLYGNILTSYSLSHTSLSIKS